MSIKGLEKFREKLPILKGKRIIFLPIFVIIIILLLIKLIWHIYQIPTESKPWTMIAPLIGIAIIEGGGLVLVFQIWYWKDRLITKYPQTAYQRIIFIGFAGITITMFLAFNNFIPIRQIKPEIWQIDPFTTFGQPLTSLFFGDVKFLDVCRYLVGMSIFVIGIMTIVRSLLTFGLDYMALIYLYYPEESEVQNYQIYSILRHPAYTGVILVCFAGSIFHLTLFHLIYFVIYTGIFCVHIFLVEEKELERRFGESYVKYKQEVPALLVKPKNWKKFLNFLIGNST